MTQVKKLKNIYNPERKRKIIGKLFIHVFEKESKKYKDIKFLAQGTLYPDIIESKSSTGSKTSKIKSHHNVGGLPKVMKLRLIDNLIFMIIFGVYAISCSNSGEIPNIDSPSNKPVNGSANAGGRGIQCDNLNFLSMLNLC